MSYYIQQCITRILVLFYSLVALVPSCHAAANLALGKPYTVSPLPNYRLSAPSTDRTSLTDGIYSKGYFWAQKTTVGWHPVPGVEILIDLEKVSIIDGITFDTARGIDAGVYYPAQIHAFVGPDREHLLYVGDIADQPDNQPGAYRTKKFQLANIKAKGRYVLLEIVAQKSWGVFCDEIEVLEGTKDSGKTGSLTVEAARKLAKRLKWPGIELKMLNSFLAENGATSADRMAAVERRLALAQKLNSPEVVNNAGTIDTQLLATRAALLQRKFPKEPLLVESVNPWAPLAPFSSVTGVAPQQLSLIAPAGGYDHLAVLITNLKMKLQMISLSLAKIPKGSAELILYQVPFVKSASLEYVADPLIPEANFNLQPGESRVVFVSVRGESSGAWKSSLKVTGDGRLISIPVNCRVAKVTLPEKLSLNAVNWGYLTFGLINDRKAQAVHDLLAHHTNVVVVPPSSLHGANQKNPSSLLDFVELESYLKYHQGASKVLLGIGFGTENYKTVVGKFPFLSREWQDGFRKWYVNAVRAAGRAGFSEEQIYLYPYDEIAGEQIDDFVRLATWAKSAIPTVKFYATFGEATFKSKRWDKLLPHLDIAQASYEETLQDHSRFKGEAWVYKAEGSTRSLSPYTYYRMMSWRAFLRGYTGIGFWAYADIGDDDTAWKELARDYSVIYEGKGNSIISSRRWEAWRMGIEDYELLTMYAKAKGETAAKNLAASVFNHPEDTSKADEVRHKILTELSTMANN
ncbi:MAG: hypothetical protein ABSA06_02020 [Geobacteraceae bacterium]|jgi:hypothetical protein